MRKLSLVTLVLLLLGASLAAQAYTLRYKDVAGMARTYQATFHINGTVNAPGLPQPMPMKMDMTFLAKEKCLAVNADGTATILSEMKDGTITVNVNGQPAQQPFPAMQMTYDRSPVGKISNVKMNGSGAQMMSSMGGSNFMSQFGQGFQFPDGDVKVNDNWKVTQSMEVMPGMKFDVNATITLKDTAVTNGKTYLNLNTVMNMNMPKAALTIPAGAAGAGGAVPNMAMAMKMTMNGASYFDADGGSLYSSAVKGTMTMTIWMTDPQSGQAIQTATTMAIDGTMQMTKEEKEPIKPAATTTPAAPAE
jgi:hypothetical protein